MSEQINRAIEVLKDSIPECGVYSREITNQAFELAIECMEKELDRQENKALTINVNIQDTDFFKDLVEELAKLNNTEVEQAISRVLEKHKPTEGVGR